MVGRVKQAFAQRLADFPETFAVSERAVTLASGLDGFERRTEAVAQALHHLKESGEIRGWRDEPYPVLARWGKPPLLVVERAATPLLGVRAYGVHLNGYVRSAAGLKLWVGRRSKTKQTAPGKLDHLVAGGQPYGISVWDNLKKEAAEEAALPARLAEEAVAVSAISYRTERSEGLRDDVLFVYDLDLPADFEPRNTDHEIDEFFLWSIDRVAETVRDTDEFKFNVALVNIDFLIRHGRLTPDDPDYVDILHGLRLCE
jgi:isopentenyldiphosphate isomerase